MSRAAAMLLALALGSAGCRGGEARAEERARAGLELARSGDVAGAVAAFEEALADDPGNLRARYNLGVARLTQGRHAEAAAQFRAFLERRPRDVPARLSLARALASAGEREASVAALQQAVAGGLAEHAAFELPEFEGLRSDLRFVQLEAVVAQRAGVRPEPITEFADRARGEYGGRSLGQPVELPGTRINRPSCGAPGAAACEAPPD